MTNPKEALIVIGDEVIRIDLGTLELYTQCAGQMINDNDIYDYYKGIKPKRKLDKLAEFHYLLRSLT